MTPADIRAARWQSIAYRGNNAGHVVHVQECVDEPRLGKVRRRQERQGDWTETLYVDGERVSGADAAARLLAERPAERRLTVRQIALSR